MNCMNYDISLDVSTEKEESRIHLLPMKIEATQAVNTEEYFDKQIVQTGERQEVSMLGKQLIGNTLELPEPYTGLICEANHNPRLIEEKKGIVLKTESKFNKINYWNWETEISSADKIPKLFKYLEYMHIINNNEDCPADKHL